MGRFLDEDESTQSVQFEDSLLGELWDEAEEFTGIGGLVVDGIEDLFGILEANRNTVTIEDKREALKAIEDSYRGWHDVKQKYDEIREKLREMEYRITNLRSGASMREEEELSPEDKAYDKKMRELNKELDDLTDLEELQTKEVRQTRENIEAVRDEIEELQGLSHLQR